MINPDEADGGLQHGPKTFAEITGRNRTWSAKPPVVEKGCFRACPVCGVITSQRAEHLWHKSDGTNDWEYARCVDCGTIYVPAAPTPESLERVYKSFPAQQEWLRVQQNEVELGLDRKKFQWGLELAGWPFGHRRIMDIGCSTGTLLEVAGEMADGGGIGTAACLCGQDVNTDALEVAKKRLKDRSWRHIELLEENLEPDGNLGGSFELVVLWEVLEHVLDPLAMLRRALGFLVPGGKLLICVPNAESLAVKVLHDRAPVFGLGHLQLFSAHTLTPLLQRAGFTGDVQYISIISWYKEIGNWLALHDWKGADGPDKNDDFLLPSPEHIREGLLGYKLVCLAEAKP